MAVAVAGNDRFKRLNVAAAAAATGYPAHSRLSILAPSWLSVIKDARSPRALSRKSLQGWKALRSTFVPFGVPATPARQADKQHERIEAGGGGQMETHSRGDAKLVNYYFKLLLQTLSLHCHF